MNSTTPVPSSHSDHISVGLAGAHVLHATGVLSVATLVASSPELSEAIQEEMAALRSGLRSSATVEREYDALSERVLRHFTYATSETWSDEDLSIPFASFHLTRGGNESHPISWAMGWNESELPHVVNEFVLDAQRGLRGFRLMVEEVPTGEGREQKAALLHAIELLLSLGEAILSRPTPRMLVTYAYAPILLAAIIDQRLGFDYIYDVSRLLTETLSTEDRR